MSILPWVVGLNSSIKERNWYSALSVALTLPDICGKLQHGRIGSRQRFTQWWGEYLLPTYTSTVGPDRVKHVFLSGSDAYALRCSFLHEGIDAIDHQRAREVISRFQFCCPPKNGIIHLNQIGTALQLQVDIFCNDIAEGVRQWDADMETNPDVQKQLSDLLTISDTWQF